MGFSKQRHANVLFLHSDFPLTIGVCSAMNGPRLIAPTNTATRQTLSPLTFLVEDATPSQSIPTATQPMAVGGILSPFLTQAYSDDVLSINNPEFENYLGQMYPAELETKDTTESTTSASYLDLLLSIGRDGQLHTSIYDKRDDFNFHITNFPFLSSNIPSSPAYGVFISQLIRYARACSSYECFILRARRLSSKLLKQGYLVERLKSSFRKFYGRYGDLIEQYGVTLSRMLNDILTLDQQ